MDHMAFPDQARQLRIGGDFRHHLLMQIEMLRGDILHEELSARLGDVNDGGLNP
jgi:hypothetical protein